MARTDEDKVLAAHTRGTLIGRVRPPTAEERGRPEDLFRPDAVLAVSGTLPGDLAPFEQHIARLIDGVRPVARLKKKGGVSSADLRIALEMLRDRGLLSLVGIVEEAVGQWADDIAHEIAERQGAGENTIQGSGEYIPPHVMAEIQSMLEEEERARAQDALVDDVDGTNFDGDTHEMALPPSDDDDTV